MLKVAFQKQPTGTGLWREPGIGDCLFLEPALRHYSKATGEKVHLSLIGNGRVRDLFEHHPHIELYDAEYDGVDGSWVRIDNTVAYKWAVSNGRHACDAFYNQLGLSSNDFPFWERRPMFWGYPQDAPLQKADFLTIAPFSYSCASLIFGTDPSKTISLDWWSEFARKAPMPVVCLGHAGAPVIKHTLPAYGLPLRQAAAIMRASRALVSIATGLMVIAGAMDCDIVWLPSAEPAFFSDPMTRGFSESLYSQRPIWKISDVLAALDRVMTASRDAQKKS